MGVVQVQIKLVGLFFALFLLSTTAAGQKRLGVDEPAQKPDQSRSSGLTRYIPAEFGQRFGVQQVGEATAEAARRAVARTAASGPEAMLAKADRLVDQGELD